MDSTEKRWFNTREAAKYLCMSRVRFYPFARELNIPVVRRNKHKNAHRIYDKADLDAAYEHLKSTGLSNAEAAEIAKELV